MKITAIKTGQIFFQKGEKYGTTAFVKIENKPSKLICQDCGGNVWNVSNFACDVHFCFDRDFDLILTDWTAQKPHGN